MKNLNSIHYTIYSVAILLNYLHIRGGGTTLRPRRPCQTGSRHHLGVYTRATLDRQRA